VDHCPTRQALLVYSPRHRVSYASHARSRRRRLLPLEGTPRLEESTPFARLVYGKVNLVSVILWQLMKRLAFSDPYTILGYSSIPEPLM
jgi:hypothetical protein